MVLKLIRMVLVGVCVVALAGCSSTVTGVALKVTAPADSDDAVVALMDTGNYPTTPYPHSVGPGTRVS